MSPFRPVRFLAPVILDGGHIVLKLFSTEGEAIAAFVDFEKAQERFMQGAVGGAGYPHPSMSGGSSSGGSGGSLAAARQPSILERLSKLSSQVGMLKERLASFHDKLDASPKQNAAATEKAYQPGIIGDLGRLEDDIEVCHNTLSTIDGRF